MEVGGLVVGSEEKRWRLEGWLWGSEGKGKRWRWEGWLWGVREGVKVGGLVVGSEGRWRWEESGLEVEGFVVRGRVEVGLEGGRGRGVRERVRSEERVEEWGEGGGTRVT